MPENQLFDKYTVSKLKDFGIVLARNVGNELENCFHIIGKDDKLLEAINLIIVELSIVRVERFIEGSISLHDQDVFYTYYHMLWYFYELKGWSDYNFCQDAVIKSPKFINSKLNSVKDSKIGRCYEIEASSGRFMGSTIYWPTKNVNSPMSRFSYFRCIFSPKLITSSNLEDRFKVQLESKSFDDIPLLYVLAANNKVEMIKKIFASFPKEEMLKPFVQRCEFYLKCSTAMVLFYYENFDLLGSIFGFFDDNGKAYIVDKLRGECQELGSKYKYDVPHMINGLDAMSAQFSQR